MKKIVILTGITLLAVAASAQVNGSKKHCSYFTVWQWQNAYPNLFSIQLDTSAQTISFQPLSSQFGGVVSISVHEELYCGNVPLCSFVFPQPATGLTPMPAGLRECIREADPLYLHICWLKKIPDHITQPVHH
jgi:hypothetical protein